MTATDETPEFEKGAPTSPSIKIQVPEEVLKKLKDSININTVTDPLFGAMFSLFDLVPTLTTTATTATDCEKLWYNINYFEELEVPEIRAVLYHELYHCITESAGRSNRLESFINNGDDRYPESKLIGVAARAHIANIASDFQMNELAAKSGPGIKLPEGLYVDNRLGKMSIEDALNEVLGEIIWRQITEKEILELPEKSSKHKEI